MPTDADSFALVVPSALPWLSRLSVPLRALVVPTFSRLHPLAPHRPAPPRTAPPIVRLHFGSVPKRALSDIIGLLVNIYGSTELFVRE